MSEYSRYCARCRHVALLCKCPEGFEYHRVGAPKNLIEGYADLRAACVAFEELIAEGQDAKSLHRLDKAVTVMKVGFKMVKKVLRAQGATGNLKNPVPAPTKDLQ